MRAADDEALGDDDLKQLTLASMFSDLRRYRVLHVSFLSQ